MRLESACFQTGHPIPDRCAFGTPDATTHVALSQNLSPQLTLADLPAATRSIAILCVDTDVPTEATDVNQEGKAVSRTLPRTRFFHWVLVDLPPTATHLEEGLFSRGIVARGKPEACAAFGSRQGINDYTAWFASDAEMRGDYYGYDGPCPPWNDELVHHYRFTAYALDVETLGLSGRFDGAAALAAIESHVLAEAVLVGTYTLNPALR